jgi:hypothetical protein
MLVTDADARGRTDSFSGRWLQQSPRGQSLRGGPLTPKPPAGDRRCATLVIVASAVALLLVGPLHAATNVLTETDSKTVSELGRRAIRLGKDINEPARGAPEHSLPRECLEKLFERFDNIHGILAGLNHLVWIASSMTNEQDKDMADFSTVTFIDDVMDILEVDRGGVNEVVGVCSSVTLVYGRAQQTLHLLEQIDTTLRSLARRLKASLPSDLR